MGWCGFRWRTDLLEARRRRSPLAVRRGPGADAVPTPQRGAAVRECAAGGCALFCRVRGCGEWVGRRLAFTSLGRWTFGRVGCEVANSRAWRCPSVPRGPRSRTTQASGSSPNEPWSRGAFGGDTRGSAPVSALRFAAQRVEVHRSLGAVAFHVKRPQPRAVPGAEARNRRTSAGPRRFSTGLDRAHPNSPGPDR